MGLDFHYTFERRPDSCRLILDDLSWRRRNPSRKCRQLPNYPSTEPRVMIIDRYAVRAVLLTPQEEILLMRIHGPGSGKRWWITPGGGLEPGESVEQGFRRELREE